MNPAPVCEFCGQDCGTDGLCRINADKIHYWKTKVEGVQNELKEKIMDLEQEVKTLKAEMKNVQIEHKNLKAENKSLRDELEKKGEC